MCWYNSKIITLSTAGIILISAFSSCKPEIKSLGAPKYFDLKGYFQKDSVRLTKQNSLVVKTVTHNGTTETKQMHIANWGAELNFFEQSDINRPAWRDSYTIEADSNFIRYTSKDPELKTQKVIINKEGGKVKWILIFNKSKNMLSYTVEKLSYFPDSMYMIERSQSVRLLGTNKYRIKGFFSGAH